MVVLRKILCLGHFPSSSSLLFPPLSPFSFFFFLHPVFAYIPCVLRFDNRVATISLDLDDEFENEEDVAKV